MREPEALEVAPAEPQGEGDPLIGREGEHLPAVVFTEAFGDAAHDRQTIAGRSPGPAQPSTLSSSSRTKPSTLALSIQRTTATRSCSGSMKITLLPAPRAA